MKPPPSHPAPVRAAFTLIELLVAAAVSMLLVVTLLTAAQGITTNYSRTQSAVTRMGDASMAIDQMIQDLEGVVVPNFAQGEGLHVRPDPSLTNSSWLTLLTTATDTDNSFDTNNPRFTGAKRAVSYRVALQNPIDSAKSTDQTYALYRSIASALHTFKNVKPGVTNLQAQYWNSIEASPDPAPLATTDADAFFAENIVGFRVRFEYLDGTNSVWTSPQDEVRIGRDGVTFNSQAVPGGFRRAQVTVTSISPEGAKRLQGGMSLEEVLERFGRSTVRETSRF